MSSEGEDRILFVISTETENVSKHFQHFVMVLMDKFLISGLFLFENPAIQISY